MHTPSSPPFYPTPLCCSILELNALDEELYRLGAQLLTERLEQQRARGVLADMSTYQPPVHARPKGGEGDAGEQQRQEGEGGGQEGGSSSGSEGGGTYGWAGMHDEL